MLYPDLDPDTAASLARLEAQRAAIFAAERYTQALYQTLEIARDFSNETRALRACQALLRGRPLPELLRDPQASPRTPRERRTRRVRQAPSEPQASACVPPPPCDKPVPAPVANPPTTPPVERPVAPSLPAVTKPDSPRQTPARVVPQAPRRRRRPDKPHHHQLRTPRAKPTHTRHPASPPHPARRSTPRIRAPA